MSFLVGKTVEQSNVTGQTGGVYKDLLNYISGQGFAGLNPGTSVDAASIRPYQDLFSQQNARNFAQAKESAGNLSGSGLGNTIGNAAAAANSQQGAFLANLFEQRRQQDANRYLQLIMGSLSSPAGQVQRVHQPGFLDYAAKAAKAAAPFFVPGAGLAAGAAGLVGGAAGAAGGDGGSSEGAQLGQASVYGFPGSAWGAAPNTYGIGAPQSDPFAGLFLSQPGTTTDYLSGYGSPVDPRDAYGTPNNPYLPYPRRYVR